MNGQVREVRQTRTARIYSRPRLINELDRLLIDRLRMHRLLISRLLINWKLNCWRWISRSPIFLPLPHPCQKHLSSAG
jgi:hypothetical protein